MNRGASDFERRLGREIRDYETWPRVYMDWAKLGERVPTAARVTPGARDGGCGSSGSGWRCRSRCWRRLGEEIIDLLPALGYLGLFALLAFADVALILIGMIFLAL